MTIKVLVMKSGEDVIADVQEMMSKDDQVLGYFLTKPCVVTLRTAGDSDDNEQEVSVRMHPWMPLAREKAIPISTDWVVSMVTPVEKVQELYEKEVVNDGQETDQVDHLDDERDVGLTD